MRLVLFHKKGDASDRRSLKIGVHTPSDDVVVDVSAATGVSSMRAFLDLGAEGLAAAARAAGDASTPRFPLADVVLKAPIYDPEKIVCVGMNYVDHCTEQGFPIPTEPVLFSKFPSCIIASGEDIILSPDTKELDFEVELVIVVGKTCRRVAAADAMDCVAGYTVAHDVSARDWQLKKNGGQWLIGKTMDSFAPIGPAIVTTDELGDPHNLALKCVLNGTVVQESNTEQLVFKTGEIIEFCSRFFTLNPGDLIFTGTPPGVGCFRKPPLFLKPGDVVTCEVEGIGAITNTVVAEDVPVPAGK